MCFNRNAGNPNAWSVDFDQSRQAFQRNAGSNLTGRVTWQATPRNKINLSWQEQIYHRNWKGGGGATTTPEATNRDWFEPYAPAGRHLVVADDEPAAAEAGWGTFEARYRNPAPRVDGTHNPRMIRAQEQSAIYGIPGLTYRMPGRRGRRLQSSPDRDEGQQPGVDRRMSPARTT